MLDHSLPSRVLGFAPGSAAKINQQCVVLVPALDLLLTSKLAAPAAATQREQSSKARMWALEGCGSSLITKNTKPSPIWTSLANLSHLWPTGAVATAWLG